jgi:hypothetical protein
LADRIAYAPTRLGKKIHYAFWRATASGISEDAVQWKIAALLRFSTADASLENLN